MSVGLPFQTGQSLQVAMAGAEDIEAFEVRVLQVQDGGLVLLGGEETAHLGPGAAVMVRHPDDERSVCWGNLAKATQEDDGFHLHVKQLRCERMDQRGAPRKEANLAVVVSHVVVSSDGTKETRKSLGRVINVSRTGVRVRSRVPLPLSTLVHLQIDLGTNEPTVAIGQVVRIVPGSEYREGGFEVGISLARILQGTDQLYDFLSDVEGAQPPSAEGDRDASGQSAAATQPIGGGEEPSGEEKVSASTGDEAA